MSQATRRTKKTPGQVLKEYGVKIKPPTEWQYQKARINEAMSFAPPIAPCKVCGWPCVDGYVCHYCKIDESALDD